MSFDDRFDDSRREPDRDKEKRVRKADKCLAVCERLRDKDFYREKDVEKDMERAERPIPLNKVEYTGLIISERSINEIQRVFEQNGLQLVGPPQHDMHMTCEYFGRKPDADRSPVFDAKDLGKSVKITINGIGELRDDTGRVLNQGLRIDDSSLRDIKLSDGRTLLDASKNDVSHVTVSINQERTEQGKPIARAVDTVKCDFKPCEPFTIDCKIAAFLGRDVSYNVTRPAREEKEIPVDRDGKEKEKPQPDFDLKHPQITEGALTVIDVLHNAGYSADLVGGCVRDCMLGQKPKDEDITTNLEPNKTADLFREAGFKVIPTGIQHGTVTVMVSDEDGRSTGYEVTTYRIDGKSSDQRHPDSVTFTDDLKQDMARRDFTINAIAFDPRATDSDSVKDYYGGKEDLKSGTIRAVGDPRERIKEDALRMMRAVRFAAQKDMKIDSDLKGAIKDNARDIERVSKERINAELSKILVSDNARQGIADLRETGLLKHIAPDIDRLYDVKQNNPWHLYDVGRHTEKVIENTPPDKITRLAALLHDTGKFGTKSTDRKGVDHFFGHGERSEAIARDFMQDMRFSAKETKAVCQLVSLHDERLKPDADSIRQFILKHPDVTPENFDRLVDLQKADMRAQNPEKTGDFEKRMEEARAIYKEITKGPYRTQDLAMDGRDIQSVQETRRGDTVILFGKDIAIAKERMLTEVLRNPEKNNQSDLRDYLRANLKDIKAQSVNKMDPPQRDEERQMLKARNALNAIDKEIQKLDYERLAGDRFDLSSSDRASEYLERAEALVARREELIYTLGQRDTPDTPRLTDDEYKEYLKIKEAREKEEVTV